MIAKRLVLIVGANAPGIDEQPADRVAGAILDACGWAVNARLRIDIPFGTALTAPAWRFGASAMAIIGSVADILGPANSSKN